MNKNKAILKNKKSKCNILQNIHSYVYIRDVLISGIHNIVVIIKKLNEHKKSREEFSIPIIY